MLTIGKLARCVGVRPSAVRYYEARGIVPPAARGSNGYRFFGYDAVMLLRFVKRAQSLGITLREIKPLLDIAATGQAPCSHVKRVARSHLREIDAKIRELESLRKELRGLLVRRVTRPHVNEVCPIIQRDKD